ncbi:MAG: hypothetical protein U1F36_05875 [Planctomycetota bacterium]
MRAFVRRRIVACSIVLLGACASTVPHDLPELYSGVPRVDREIDALVAKARALSESGDDAAALEVVDRAIAGDEHQIDGQRLRQDILRRRGRLGLVLHEADQRILEWRDAEALYLRGRVEPVDDEKQRWFARAIERDQHSFWGWFGMAYTLRDSDPERALGIYRALWAADARSTVLAQPMMNLSRRMAADDARAFHASIREREPESGLADLAIARYASAHQRAVGAWAPLLESLRRRPFDEDVRLLLQSRITAGIPDDQVLQILDVLGESSMRRATFVAAGGASLLAWLDQRAGRPEEALEVLAHARPTAEVRRVMRRLRLQSGDLCGFLDALAADLPQAILADESNQLRGLWGRVLHGPWAGTADPLADEEQAVELCAALIGAGMLEEAESIATRARARCAPDSTRIARFDALRDEARREHAFESGLRRMLYLGYGREPKPIDEFLDEVRALSQRILDRDVVGTPATYHVPLVGELIDPFGEGLAAHLRRYNRHLILGQRAGRPPEGMMLTRLSLRDLDDGGPLALAGRSYEIIGDDRQIESLQGLLGGDLAGVALLNNYVIDHDAVVDWALNLQERRAIMHADGDAILSDPLPADSGPLDPVDVAWRLLALSPVEDKELPAAVLDLVRWHERAHLVDAFRYLPPEQNLWRVLGLIAGSGFSAASVEAELEGRAETAAVAFSAHPELALAHVASFLEADAGTSAHAAGFQRLARSLIEETEHDGAPDRAPDRATVANWFRMDPGRLRSAARAIAARQWP